MSPKLTNLRSDVARLIEDGYEASIEQNHLVVRNVPYVDASKRVRRGTLISTLAGSVTESARPDTHVIMFEGQYPCNADGQAIEAIRNSSGRIVISTGLVADHRFSSKPKLGYLDYYEKITTYATIISSPAAVLEKDATPRTFRVVQSPDDSPFVYFDNASGRAGISSVTEKLRAKSIAIIGLGGTGSYVLDFVSKTPVDEIHLIDGDPFEQHNAFRAPGAASIDALRQQPFKVDYFAEIYGRMHKGIVPHRCFITPDNLELLNGVDMVFICIDAQAIKEPIIQALEVQQTPFIDVGMGVELVDGGLTAMLRTTTSTPDHRDHVRDKNRIPMASDDKNVLYAQNIQISELNAMNACLAVIRWKKLCGFYRDTENEYFSIFALDGNHIINEDDEQ